MRIATPTMRTIVLTVFAWTLSGTLAGESRAARYVRTDVSLDGKTVLQGSTGDNGRPDADQVWDYLKTIRFKATKEFPGLAVKHDAKETVLTSSAPKGKPGGVVIDIRYGGMAMTRQLTLIRVPRDKDEREWRLDPDQVDQLFDRRFIRRSDAARLKNPQNSRR